MLIIQLGVPAPYDKVKRVVVPSALKATKLKLGRKTTHIGTLAQSVGWKHSAAVSTLEAKRQVKAKAYWLRKKALVTLKNKALEQTKNLPSLSQFGY